MTTNMKPPLRHPLTVILAEDDADLRAMLAVGLRRDGHSVIEVSDASALVAELAFAFLNNARGRDDVLVVADLRLPGTNSLNVLRELHGRGRRPPFILLTAFGGPGVYREARELGALAIFDKPFDFDLLRTEVKKVAAAQKRPAPRPS
jgi:two-component system, response regulator, stage 0 sporulation protein F